MAISKFSVRMLVLVVICWSLSTCSFKNNYSWTYPEEVKSPIVHLPHFCSQASSLLSPVANLTMTLPANTSSAATNKITAMEPLLPTVSTASSVYVGSRSSHWSPLSSTTNLHHQEFSPHSIPVKSPFTYSSDASISYLDVLFGSSDELLDNIIDMWNTQFISNNAAKCHEKKTGRNWWVMS